MPTVKLYADDTPIRYSTPKSLAARGRRIAREATEAYGEGNYAEAARLARQCVAIAVRLEASETELLWRRRAEVAEAMAS